MDSTHSALRMKGKTAVVWEEMVLVHNITTVKKDTLVLVWISSENAKNVVEKGYRVVHAASDHFYLVR